MIVLVLVRAQTLSLKPSYSRIMLMVSLEVASLSSVRWNPMTLSRIVSWSDRLDDCRVVR